VGGLGTFAISVAVKHDETGRLLRDPAVRFRNPLDVRSGRCPRHHFEGTYLFVEHFLTLALSRVPSHEVDAFKLSFAQKIDPAVQAGIISPDEKQTFCLINRIRNRFAHQPRSYFSDNDAEAIWNSLSPRMIDRFSNAGRPGPEYFDLPLDLFKCCILAMCSILNGELPSRPEPST
jgi:hypothetical protein